MMGSNEDIYIGKLKLRKLDGYWFSAAYSDNLDVHLSVRDLSLGDNDVVIVAVPKSGSAWMERIVNLIRNDADVTAADSEKQDRMSLMLERVGASAVLAVPESRLIKTHYPYSFLPRSFREGKGKIVYITRNPKDVSVSMYFFYQAVTRYGYRGTFQEFYKLFCNGTVFYGPWYKHVREFWEHRHDENVKFVFYEDLQKEPKRVIQEIAVFLGKDLTKEAVAKIAAESSFDSMKKNPKTNYEWLQKEGLMDMKISKYMRKGQVGDWKRFYSPSMSMELDILIQKELSPVGISYSFE